MLAQGQYSSAKRGGLAVVSSGLIFLKKTKNTHKKRDGLETKLLFLISIAFIEHLMHARHYVKH